MVSRQTNRRKTIKTSTKICLIIGTIVLVGVAVFVALFLINQYNMKKSQTDNDSMPSSSEQTEPSTENEPEPEPEIPRVDFQPVVDAWVGTVGGDKSVLIYDLDRGEVVGSYNPNENYSTASLYKLFVVYEGYRRVQNGEWQMSDSAGSTGYNIGECLDLAIRRSYSPCAETLWGMIGRDELENIIRNDFGISDSDISHLISNPNDILKMMMRFYEHEDITNADLVARMKDSFLNQPVTEYDWRQGLPSGFSRANVYNKVGWDYNPDGGYWNIYHDAAIVEFPEQNRHFAVVVMTNHVPFQQIRKFGSMIEEKFYGD